MTSTLVIFNDQQAVGWEGLNRLLLELDMAGTISSCTEDKGRFSRIRLKDARHQTFPRRP